MTSSLFCISIYMYFYCKHATVYGTVNKCYKTFRISFGHLWNVQITFKLTGYLEFDSLICYPLKKINRNFPEWVNWVPFLKTAGSSMFFVCLTWLFKMSLSNVKWMVKREWETAHNINKMTNYALLHILVDSFMVLRSILRLLFSSQIINIT